VRCAHTHGLERVLQATQDEDGLGMIISPASVKRGAEILRPS